MPVNMDPAKKYRRVQGVPPSQSNAPSDSQPEKRFGEETEEDRIKALADAERKNL